MKSLLIYLKKYKKESFFAPLFKLLEASFELIVPLVIAAIIDTGIKNRDIAYITGRSMILVLLAVVGCVSAITAQYFAAKAATGFGKELRCSLYRKIQSFSFSELDMLGTSSLITRLTNDVNQVQNGVNMVLRLFLRSPFIVFGAMIMAFFIDVKCALIFVAAIVILFAVVFGIMSYSIPMHKKVQEQLDSVTLITRENLSGARVIRAFTEEEHEFEAFNRRNGRLAHLQKATGRVTAFLNPGTYIVINAAIVILIYSGALQVNAGNLSQGQVVALYNYMSQILVELLKLANLIVTITKSFASASRIEAVMNQQTTLIHKEKGEQSNAFVEFRDVSLIYGNASCESLKNISFKADRGEVIGIIGGTGSGKSSLVQLIPHFYDVAGGAVYVGGKDVQTIDDEILRAKIGFVQQKAVLFKGTVRENMQWGKADAGDEEIVSALKAAQVYDVIQEKGGLDAPVEQNGSNFSGGQKQRLSVARALVRRPDILIFDDSASALDYATESRLREEIYSLPYHPTVFIVSQRASSVMEADCIIVLDDGEMVGKGTHAHLLKTCEVYREIYASQFEKEAVS